MSIPQKLNYIPALDGLRAIAILLVVISHAGFEKAVPGSLGVIIFFVISGFLLTRQMIVEVERTGTLNIKAFYLRRLLRLMPALIFYLLLICSTLYLLGVMISTPQVLSGLFYFANYYHVFVGYPAHSPMPILWSLSVEEHFYILFPFIIILFRNNLRKAIPWLIVATLLALVWRYILFTTCADVRWA
jgi:peptidoglycan/LPS O-acetylase OafA/YrhL